MLISMMLPGPQRKIFGLMGAPICVHKPVTCADAEFSTRTSSLVTDPLRYLCGTWRGSQARDPPPLADIQTDGDCLEPGFDGADLDPGSAQVALDVRVDLVKQVSL